MDNPTNDKLREQEEARKRAARELQEAEQVGTQPGATPNPRGPQQAGR